MSALRCGVQTAVFLLGRVPRWHQTDNSTAATHDLSTGKRGFNEEYEGLMRHLGMSPRTIEVGKKNQNGDVEALNGALKRRLRQHLAMRGSRDFESVHAYTTWLEGVLERANGLRAVKLQEDLAAMTILRVDRLPEYRELTVGVSPWSTIRVLRNAYSVPSRLIGEEVTVRVYDDRLDVFYLGKPQLEVERLLGDNGHRINYRHIIWSLVQKPAAFLRYRYREDLFPTVTFRRGYDELCKGLDERRADIEYLRILHLAASTMETDVDAALSLLLEANVRPTAEQVKSLVTPEQPVIPKLDVPEVDLSMYDTLLACGGEV
jgi:hypothetical protein